MKKNGAKGFVILALALGVSFLLMRLFSPAQPTLAPYFFRDLQLAPVHRPIETPPTPEQALQALFKGPTSTEKNQGVFSVIPRGTRLLDFNLDAHIAYVNVNHAVTEIKGGGYHGKAAVAQIVCTLTEFPSIQEVQLLVEGNKDEVIGGEGLTLDEPFSRGDFSDFLTKR